MDDSRSLLRAAMHDSGTSQSSLARVSGVRQPSISQFLSGAIEMSDEQVDRLLACMGYRLEVTRRLVQPGLTRSERRSWLVHRQVAALLGPSELDRWRPRIERNIQSLTCRVQGQPHERNLARWAELVKVGDEAALRRALTCLDRASIEMREVSPFAGVLPDRVRLDAIQNAS